MKNIKKEAEQERKSSSKSSSPTKESKIPVRSKKLQAPQPPQTKIPSPAQTNASTPQCQSFRILSLHAAQELLEQAFSVLPL